MASTVSLDYELLRQPLPEKTLEGAVDFHAVQDATGNPVLFTVHRDGRLMLLVQGASNGDMQLIDLSSRLGVDKSFVVQALAVSQTSDSKIYIAFATRARAVGSDAKKTNQGPSKVWLLAPLLPTHDAAWYDGIGPQSLLKQSSSVCTECSVSKLLLVSTLLIVVSIAENITLRAGSDFESRWVQLPIYRCCGGPSRSSKAGCGSPSG